MLVRASEFALDLKICGIAIYCRAPTRCCDWRREPKLLNLRSEAEPAPRVGFRRVLTKRLLCLIGFVRPKSPSKSRSSDPKRNVKHRLRHGRISILRHPA